MSIYASGPLRLFRRKAKPAEAAKIMADVRVKDALAALALHRDSYAAVAALRHSARSNG